MHIRKKTSQKIAFWGDFCLVDGFAYCLVDGARRLLFRVQRRGSEDHNCQNLTSGWLYTLRVGHRSHAKRGIKIIRYVLLLWRMAQPKSSKKNYWWRQAAKQTMRDGILYRIHACMSEGMIDQHSDDEQKFSIATNITRDFLIFLQPSLMAYFCLISRICR